MRHAIVALALAVVGAASSCSVANLGRAPSPAGTPLGADERKSVPLAAIVSGSEPRWIKRSLPFLDTAGAELVFLDSGAAVLVVQQGAAVSTDLGKTWDVLPPEFLDTLYTNNGGRSFVLPSTIHEQWYLHGQLNQSFAVTATAVAGNRLYVLGRGASSVRVSSIALPTSPGPTRHRIFWYDMPACLAAAGSRVLAGGTVRDAPVLYVIEDGCGFNPRWWGLEGDPSPIALSFLDADRGLMLMSDGTVERTTDGCATWQTAGSIPVDRARSVRAMTFVDERTGYVVGEDGLVLVTRDGARTWLVGHPPTLRTLSRVVADRDGVAWAVGDAGTIITSRNGGDTWEKADLGIGENLRSVTVYKQATWIVGDGSLYILPPASGAPLVPEPAPAPPPPNPLARKGADCAPAARDPFAPSPATARRP